MLRMMVTRLRPRRLVPTTLAVVLAVGFVVGTMVFGDSTRAAIYDEYARAARHVDVAVSAEDGQRLPLSTVESVRGAAGVATVAGRMVEPLLLLDRRGRVAGRPAVVPEDDLRARPRADASDGRRP